MHDLKNLIEKYGKKKINTLTKYPSILTLHKLGEKGRLLPEMTTDISGESMYATEKIDGTNVRIISYNGDYAFGSREFILYHCDDLYFDPAMGIVEGLKRLDVRIPQAPNLTVVYGELYGMSISSNSKWYGKDSLGFRVFDVAVYKDLSILELPQESISLWREKETENGIVYGQNFLSRKEIDEQFSNYALVPAIEFELKDFQHSSVLDALRQYSPTTRVALSETATNKCEGVVLRNESRTKIVKLRFEDYERTLR